MSFKRLDAIDINYVDSAADRSLKIAGTTGVGEARLYAGNNEKDLDEFFELDNIECFFMLKEDLVNYLQDAKEEYENPSREYQHNISNLYIEKVKETNSISFDKIKVYFKKTYDSGHRYYLVLYPNKENRQNYAHLRNICLPRMTVITFVKLEDNESHKRYIYMKPIFYIDPAKREALDEQNELATLNNESSENEKIGKERYRKKQTQYRLSLLEKMPACLITNVSDDRLLVACHVKPYCVCDENEKYDVNHGTVLTPTYHTLFDLGFITFDKDGRLLISPFLSNLNKSRLNLIELKAYRLQQGTEKYMKYHREHIFNTIKFDDLDFID